MDMVMALLCFAITGLFTSSSFANTDIRVNVAVNKKAKQSSTVFYNGYSWDASLAIDGVTKYEVDCECCSSTSGSEIPWLEIDLENTYNIGRIDVFGRQDSENRLLGFKLFIGDSYNDTLYSEPVYINNVSKTEYFNLEGHFIIPVGNVSIRYIRIYKDNDETYRQMSICEVEVYEACKDFQFGPDCRPCHCSMSPCDKVTGRCSSDCLSGWHGAACDISCADGRYGINCLENCRCLNPGSCDKLTGFCTDGHCTVGWKGHYCNISSVVSLDKKVTMSSLWSKWWRREFAVDGDIRTNASVCRCCTATNFEISPWLEIDLGISYRIEYIIIYGRTDKFEPVYLKDMEIYAGDHQDIENELPIYTCDDDVTFLNITLDNPVITQFVTLKLPGEYKKLEICEMQLLEGECENGSFGRLCNNECHCQGEPCDKYTGICPSGQCLAGYLGETCSEECDDRHFGNGCSAACGFCFNNEACDKAQGNCRRCSPGYMGHLCVESCTEGRFGMNCSSYCGMCKDSDVCDHVTGNCPRGCQAGYEQHLCNISCKEGRYGESCTEFCGHCAGNKTCNITNGHCNDGCIKGFEEPLCGGKIDKLVEDTSSDKTFGSAIGIPCGLLFVTIMVLIGALILRRRMRRRRNHLKATMKTSTADTANGLTSENTAPLICDNDTDTDESPAVVQFSLESLDDREYYGFAPRAEDIKVFKIWDYIHVGMANNCEYFCMEFESLKKGLQFEFNCATERNNKSKNRYKEIFAYDRNRVPLIPTAPGEGTYINASFIDGYEKVSKFIASQGPTPEMVDDFWRMIWQHQCSVIVMLTNLYENDMPKCLQYWPRNEPESYGAVTVKLIKEETFSDFVIRDLGIKKIDQEMHTIKQYHFTVWPDKTIPETTWSLVNFWRVVRHETDSKDQPIVVHCSAGVGRTGTFIALDNLYHQAINEGCIRPLQMVETLRRQRVNMIQTKEQYVYLHEALSEALLFGTHSIKTEQYEQAYNYLLQTEEGNSKTNLEIQFELINQSLEGMDSSADKEIQVTDKTTCIEKTDVPGDQDTVYANQTSAVCTNSMDCVEENTITKKLCQLVYKGQATLYLTTVPEDAEGFQDFIGFLMSMKLTTLVQLGNDESKLICGTQGDVQITATDEKTFGNWSQSTLEMTYRTKEILNSRTVNQFKYNGWIKNDDTLDNIQSFLEFLLKVQQHSTEGPIVVIDSEETRFGLFCVTLNEVKRMNTAQSVNIIHAVKTLRHQKKSCVSSFEQYKSCFEIINLATQQTELYQNA